MEINKIYKGNCIELSDKLNNESIDCIITSPPYYNSSHKYQRGTGFHYTSDVGEPLYVIQDVFEALKPKLKEDGIVCLNLGFSYGETGVMRPFDIINRLREKVGYFVNDVIIWHKNNPIPMRNRLTNAIEYIFILSKHPIGKYYTKEYTHNVWKFSVDSGEKGHSAVFPIDLPLNCIEHFTKENDIVLDCFFGYGTTGIVSKELNRFFIGIEKEKYYYEMSINRLICKISTNKQSTIIKSLNQKPMQSEQQTIQFAHEYAQALAMVVVENLIQKQTQAKSDGNKIRSNAIQECIKHIKLGFRLDK